MSEVDGVIIQIKGSNVKTVLAIKALLQAAMKESPLCTGNNGGIQLEAVDDPEQMPVSLDIDYTDGLVFLAKK